MMRRKNLNTKKEPLLVYVFIVVRKDTNQKLLQTKKEKKNKKAEKAVKEEDNLESYVCS